MNIKVVVSGKLLNNTYVVVSNQNNAVVVDPSLDFEKIKEVLESSGAKLKYIICTHGHYDHTASALLLKELYGAEIVIHQRDAEMLYDSKKSLSYLFSNHPNVCRADIEVSDGDSLCLDELKFDFISTPGHSNGSMVIVCQDVMFTGDTVLKGTVGRTDLFGGNDALMIQSVKNLSKIEKNYTLLCGHEESSTLDFEKKNNPYFLLYA